MSGSDKGGISDEDERRDEVLKRMLNTPPKRNKAEDRKQALTKAPARADKKGGGKP